MKSKVLGVINLGEREDYIKDLTFKRPLATIPFAGRYRIIDFILSNMVNTGIDSIALVVKDKFHSLNDHIGPGKYWDLDRKTGGLRTLYPSLIQDQYYLNKGDISVMKDNLRYFEKTRKEHILLTRSNYIGNIDFSPAIDMHIKNDSEITILTRKIKDGRNKVDLLGFDIVNNDDGKLSIGRNLGNIKEFDLSTEMYIIKKEVFLDILYKTIEEGIDGYFKKAFLKRLPFYKSQTYTVGVDILPIASVQQYYNASMRILDPDYANYLFYKNGKIYTKVKDAPSTIYKVGSNVNNALIANSCIIEGTVENSILFRGVHVQKGAIIRNSIVFENTVIGRGSHINYAILDKYVNISPGKVLMGDGGLPYFINKGASL